MGIRILTNVDAINAQRNLGQTSASFSRAVGRLSSGLRITGAADAAAGLSISEKLRAQGRGMSQAIRNAQDGISLVQTAEGALGEVSALLQRIRELALQASNGTLSSNDLQTTADEVVQLRDEINRITQQTEFNGTTLLDGGLVTAIAGASEVDVGVAVGTLSGMVFSAVDVGGAAGTSQFTLSASATSLTLRGTLGGTATSQTLTVAAMAGGGIQSFNYSQFGVKFTIAGTQSDATLLAANLGNNTSNDLIQTGAGGALTLQVGASAGQTMAVTISDAQANAIGSGGGHASLNAAVVAFDAAEAAEASNLVLSVDQAITDISTVRSTLGAAQNRLGHTIANLGVGVENLSASESRIRDADVAKETVDFVKAQILQQAGVAVLAQANSAPQSVLALLS